MAAIPGNAPSGSELEMPGSIFPSDFISKDQKNQKPYCLKWAKAVDGIGINGSQNGLYRGIDNEVSKYAVWRSYARGQQSIDKYKPILGQKGNDGKNNLSFRAINWEILDVATKTVNLLIGKLIKQNNDIGIRAIDKYAQDAKRKKKLELKEHIINKPFYDSISKQTGLQFQQPIQEDMAPLPENVGELDVYMDMFYKEEYCLIMQDMIKMINENDNYQNILVDVARNLIEVGGAATKTYPVGRKIRRRSCIPERMVISSTTKDNGEDVKYIGEYWDLTIGELKEIAGDQLSEKEYKDIAMKVRNVSFDNINIEKYYQDNLCYPWDNTKITILDLVWFSPDWETMQVKKNAYGNINVYKKDFSWWADLEKQGVTEESFNRSNESEVIRYPLNNQYQCLWIKGTDYIVNYGLSKNMLRNQSSVGRVVGPYTLYKLKKCPIETMMPIFDATQINWLQYQFHSAKSVPAGPAIEFTALQDISIEGAAGKKLSPKQVLQIYFDTGVLLWRRRDAAGNLSNFKPIQELSGSSADPQARHFKAVADNINLLRDIIGLNELTDGTTPNSEMGKAVAEMASGASMDALRYVHFAFDQINLGTQERTVMHISGMAAAGLAPEYAEALGLDKMAMMGLMSDLTHHELGCYLLRQPTEEMKARMTMYMAEATKPGGYLLPEEALEIDNEPNIYRAIQLLKMYRQQKARQARKDAEDQMRMNAEEQMRSAKAKQEGDLRTLEMEMNMKGEFEWTKAQAQVWADKQIKANEAFLLSIQVKLQTGQAITEEEQKRITELMKIAEQGQWQLQIAKQNAKKSNQVSSSGRVR